MLVCFFAAGCASGTKPGHPDAAVQGPDAAFTFPDTGPTVDATWMDAAADAAQQDGGQDGGTCSSRTFGCAQTSCDALTQYCLLVVGIGSCGSLSQPNTCVSCSAQVGPTLIAALCSSGGNVTGDGQTPEGCTVTCQ